MPSCGSSEARSSRSFETANPWLACMRTTFATLRQYLVDLGLELLREILKLRIEPRVQALAGPHQLLAQGREPRAAPLVPLDQRRAEERRPLFDQVPAMPVGHVRRGSPPG